MRILAIVVTYYPEKILLGKNISAFIDNVDKVLIWENTPDLDKNNYRFIKHEKVDYCGDGINSISHGLNYGWHYAKSNGFDYLLTMDQDSVFINFVIMKEFVKCHLHEMMLVSPHLNQSSIKSISVPNGEISRTQVDGLITSGALFYIGLLDKLDGFDEKLAIDGIDTDIYLRANQLGIPSYRIDNCNLIQRFGEPNVFFFMGRRFEFSIYSASRLKSIIEAHIILIRKYKNMSLSMRRYIIRHYIIEKIIEIILFEDQKFSKINAIIVGIFKGIRISI